MGGVIRKREVIIFVVTFSDVSGAEITHFTFKNIQLESGIARHIRHYRQW